jgi:hypothetical protein
MCETCLLKISEKKNRDYNKELAFQNQKEKIELMLTKNYQNKGKKNVQNESTAKRKIDKIKSAFLQPYEIRTPMMEFLLCKSIENQVLQWNKITNINKEKSGNRMLNIMILLIFLGNRIWPNKTDIKKSNINVRTQRIYSFFQIRS